MEDRSLEPIASALVRVVALICLTSAIIFYADSCRLDKEIMDDCKRACGSWKGIEKVTSTKCVCSNGSGSKISTSPWVLPRN